MSWYVAYVADAITDPLEAVRKLQFDQKIIKTHNNRVIKDLCWEGGAAVKKVQRKREISSKCGNKANQQFLLILKKDWINF